MQIVLEAFRRVVFLARNQSKILKMANRTSLESTAEPRKSLFQKYLELNYSVLRWNELSILYFAQQIDLKGRSIRRDYLPYTVFRVMRNKRNLSLTPSRPYNYACLLQDKLVFERFFSAYGISVVPTVGVIERSTCDFGLLGSGSLRNIGTQQIRGIELFCKPRFGIKGKGVFRLRFDLNEIYVNGKPVNSKELEHRFKVPYLCQRLIEQHPITARFHPRSVNTLRVVTFRQGTDIEVFLTYLRMGGSHAITDNGGSARAVVRIDPATGRFFEKGYWSTDDHDQVSPISAHPDTGVVFSGVFFPYFEECCKLVVVAHNCLPVMQSVGWDLAVTTTGPLLLEGNEDWGSSLAMWLMPDFSAQFRSRIKK